MYKKYLLALLACLSAILGASAQQAVTVNVEGLPAESSIKEAVQDSIWVRTSPTDSIRMPVERAMGYLEQMGSPQKGGSDPEAIKRALESRFLTKEAPVPDFAPISKKLDSLMAEKSKVTKTVEEKTDKYQGLADKYHGASGLPDMDRATLLEEDAARMLEEKARSNETAKKLDSLASENKEAIGKAEEMANKHKEMLEKYAQLPSLPTANSALPKLLDKHEPIKVKEIRKKGEDGYKEFMMKEKKPFSLPDNTYLNAVLGLTASNGNLSFQASPHFGLKFTERLQAGGGLTLQHTEDKSAEVPTVFGLKSQARYTVLKQAFHLDLETVSLLENMSYWGNVDDEIKKNASTVLMGATYETKMTKHLSLTFSALYNFNNQLPAPALQSPVIGRIGIKI